MNNENNNNQSNDNNIDDILDILQKRKLQDIKDGKASDDFPTRIDNTPVKNNSGNTFVYSASDTQPSTAKPNTSVPEKNVSPAPDSNYDKNPKDIPATSSDDFSATTTNLPVSKIEKSDTNIVNGSETPKHPDIKKQETAPSFSNNKATQSNQPSVVNKTPSAEKSTPPSTPSPSKPKQGNVPSRPAQNSQKKMTVSLSDFDDKEVEKATLKALKKKKKKARGIPGWVKIIIYLVFVVSISVLISATVIKVGNDIFAFVKSDKEATIEISENATLKDIAATLQEAGVIEYPWIFEKFAEFRISKRSYLTKDFIAGEHILSPSMNYDKIIAALCVSAYDKSVVRVTIPEGYSIDGILDLFIENGIIKEEDREEYLKQIQEFPYEYNFITKLTEQGSFDNTDRIHRLEGYLFPDTYDFYKNENPVAAIDKLLGNFENKFNDEMYTRTAELGMTVDEIITLASMIEAEGDSPVNFAKISSVFHNRLNDKSGTFRFLGSDATTLYAFRIAGHDKKVLGANDTDFEHPYNTYTSIGLPPGPICNPGIEAIYAALYPEDTNYLYFLTMANGETVFARTATEHNNNIAKSNRLAAEQKAAQ